MKKLLPHLLLSLTIFFSYSSQADEIAAVNFNGDDLLLPIPVGFCDATEGLVGIFLMEYLTTKPFDDISLPPLPKIVFTRCGFENDLNDFYPWGYIGLQNNPSPAINQKAYNKQLTKIFGNSKLVNKLNEMAEDSIEIRWSEYGQDEAKINMGEFGVLWSDEDVLIIQIQVKLLTGGEIMIEDIVASTTMLSKTTVNYYISEMENGKTTVLENAFALINNSKRLKRVN